ncbi:MAG: fimbrial protein [Yersiniaceae bacterium]|nr:fimbrial protein [Yersiniaceae bacterium]
MTNRFTCRACLLALLPLLAPAAFAARDCYFERSSVTLTGAYVKLNVTGSVSGDTLLANHVAAEYSGNFISHCETGNDGQNLWGQTNLSGTGYRWHDPDALFPTNVPGITYSVHVNPRIKPDVADGYLPNSSSFIKVADISDSADDSGGPLAGKPWDIYLAFYQDANYKGNQGQTKVHPREHVMLGQFRLGGSGHNSNVVSIYVNENSFGMDINAPTCTSAVTSVSDNTVNFGDVNIADAAGGRGPTKPFSITLSNCSLLNGVTTRLTTALVNGGGNMMANALTGQNVAAGVGVQIRDNYSNTLRPNDANSTAKMTNLAMPGTVKLDFTAQLREDGSPVKPGAFQAIGTFNITYQ